MRLIEISIYESSGLIKNSLFFLKKEIPKLIVNKSK